MKLLIQIFALSCLLLISAANVYSCSCEEYTQRKAFREASAVFIGQAVEYLDNPEVEKDGRLIVKLKVEKSWKGAKTQEVIISSTFGSACGFTFEKGKRYLVYSYGQDLFTPTVCSRSGEIIGAGYSPNKDQQREIRKLNSWWYRFFSRVLPF